MPKGIITRFTVVMQSQIADQRLVWKSGVILKKDRAEAEIIEYYSRREIRVRITGKNKKELMTIITYELDKIHDSFSRLKYKKLIPCNCKVCKISKEPYFYEFEKLKRFTADRQSRIQCQESYEMVNVRGLIDDVINQSLSGAGEREMAAKTVRQPEKIERNNVFVSYSHKDKDVLEKVQVHLKVLEIEGFSVNLWDDTQIKPGMKWKDEIEKALSVAKVAILLISTEFLASDFVRTDELPHLLKAAENDGATILPLILKPCRFSKNKKLSVFQAVNDPAKPLSKLTEAEQDEVLLDLAERIAVLM